MADVGELVLKKGFLVKKVKIFTAFWYSFVFCFLNAKGYLNFSYCGLVTAHLL